MVAFGVTKHSPDKPEVGFFLRRMYNASTSVAYCFQLNVNAVNQNHDEWTIKPLATR